MRQAKKIALTAKDYMMQQGRESRYDYVDLLKGIGILLVVWGHSVAPRSVYLYSFHMPLFFFLSGYLHKDKPFKQFVVRKFNTLYVPYVVFTIGSWLFYLVRLLLHHQQERLADHFWKLTSVITGTVDNGGNNPIWFLTCLLVVSILFLILRQLFRSPAGLGLAVVISSGIGYGLSLANIRLYFNTNIAFSGLVFYYWGFIARQHALLEKLNHWPRWTWAGLALVAEIFHIFTAFLNPRISDIEWVNMAGNTMGNYFLFYLSAGLGIFAFLSLGYFIQEISFLNYLGKNSLIILAVHKPVLLLLNEYFLWFLDTGSPYYGLFLSVLDVALIVPVISLVNSKFPWMIGKRPFIPEPGTSRQ